MGMSETSTGRTVLAREICWLSAIGFGLIAFALELFSPEKRWRKFRWFQSNGKIRLDDSDDDEAEDGVDAMNGGGAVYGKNEDGEMESPVITANLYERLTFSWLTRKCPLSK